ncbi:hypothetical protein KC19_3G156300 [Ceratodon purpureus]|uniref:Uncharacterized protein n=1 Tax=Ceratodon purpureus TaxID=3225 RepID=A0A8T0ILD6_CERPU|nr:hypothetical protein KC19_3G156300 [Ceratodon purpureus]
MLSMFLYLAHFLQFSTLLTEMLSMDPRICDLSIVSCSHSTPSFPSFIAILVWYISQRLG